jgi:hypothetical protein
MNQLYRITLPQDTGGTAHQVPSLTKIQDVLTKIMGKADLSGATPSNVAGRPAYTVEVSPKHDGGLIGSAQLAWDAVTGAPLRAAVYASGNPKPVLELKATDISFGPVADGDLATKAPADAKVTDLDLSSGAQGKDASGAGDHPDVTGPQAVGAKLGFPLSAPDTLVGLPRHEVRLIQAGDQPGALVTYGAGFGGIAVLEQLAKPGDQSAAPTGGHDGAGGLSLPKVSIGGNDGQELATALGTVVRFQRGGVQYTIIGSVPPSAAEAAARGL